jgi:hypothetical protein
MSKFSKKKSGHAPWCPGKIVISDGKIDVKKIDDIIKKLMKG